MSTATMKRFVTGFRCEVRDCFDEAEWYVNFDRSSYYWCAKHTIARMANKGFWQLRLQEGLVRD